MADESSDRERAAEEYLAKRDDELLALFASGGREHAFPEDALQRAKQQYEILKANVRDRVCHNETIRTLATSESANRRVMLVIAIADLIATEGALAAAALIVHEGVQSLCHDIWNEHK